MLRLERQRTVILTVLAAGSLAALCVSPFIGMVSVPLSALYAQSDATSSFVLWQLRIPRVLHAYVVGAVLAVGGVVFQALFRNLLATPFTLGVSSGAALGAALYFKIGAVAGVFGAAGALGAAFAGALATITLVYLAAQRARVVESVSLLLAGVVISFFFSSLILFLQYLSDFTELYRISHWLMGRLDIVGFGPLLLVVPFAVLGVFVSFIFARDLNLLTAGEDFARTRGVRVERARLVLYLSVSLMVAAVVAQCGVIGFVGVVVPYVCRALLGAEHRAVIPAALMLGGAFLVASDTVARIIIAPAEVPAGVVTALVGAPLFVWLMLRSRVL